MSRRGMADDPMGIMHAVAKTWEPTEQVNIRIIVAAERLAVSRKYHASPVRPGRGLLTPP